jgi:hypothetical protein
MAGHGHRLGHPDTIGKSLIAGKAVQSGSVCCTLRPANGKFRRNLPGTRRHPDRILSAAR